MDEECCNYWPIVKENFWISFLKENLDHFEMLSVFQTVFGEKKNIVVTYSHISLNKVLPIIGNSMTLDWKHHQFLATVIL